MVEGSEVILSTFVMMGISLFLIRTILVIRNRRAIFSAGGGDSYSGDAKEPGALSKPDAEALEDMDSLLEKAGFYIPEDE